MSERATSTEPNTNEASATPADGRRHGAERATSGSAAPPESRRTPRSTSDAPVATSGGTSWTGLTGFQRDLLKSIRRIDEDRTVPTGKTVKAEVESMYGEDINHGRLYQNLNHLVERGCIDKVVVDGRTNAYYLTDEAVGMLEEAAMDFIETCEMRGAASQS